VITDGGPDLARGGSIDAEVLDATGTIVLPGFVDSHRHTWQAAIRGCLPCCTVDGYLGEIIAFVGPVYQPEDVHASNLLGALEALDAGITTRLTGPTRTTRPSTPMRRCTPCRERDPRRVRLRYPGCR
jgi:cytosine/adenosine deaminase-related metal-dependent hydrolase